MISLNDRRIDRIPQMVRGESKPLELLVCVQGVMHQGRRTPLLQGGDCTENTRERGLLHTPAVGGTEHGYCGTRKVTVCAFEKPDRVVSIAALRRGCETTVASIGQRYSRG